MLTYLKENKKWVLLLLALVIILLYFVHLNSYPLMDPDEGRYAEIPREMLATGNFITPHLNGVKYFEKPALQYWLTAFSMYLFGPSNGATRVVPACAAVLNIFFTAYIARLMYNKTVGMLTAVIMATMSLTVIIGSIDILDMLISMFITISMVAFYKAHFYRQRHWLLLFYAALALGLLTKGLISIVLPLGIIFWYMLLTKEWRIVKDLLYWPGIGLFFIISVPWFYLVCHANADFFYFFFIREHFLRFATKMMHRYKPFWFFIPIVLVGTFPWLGFLPALFSAEGVLRHNLSKFGQKDNLYLLLWFFIIFIFFSISDSKLAPYIMPCMSPLAVLLGATIWQSLNLNYWLGHGLALTFGGWITFVVALLGTNYYYHFLPNKIVIHNASLLLATLFFGSVLLLILWWRTKNMALTTLAIIIISFSSAFGLQNIQSYVANTRTAQYIAADIATIRQPNAAIVSYGDYIQGIPFYLKTRVYVANYRGELAFGSYQKEGQGWFLNSAELQRLWSSPRQVFIVFDGGKRTAVEQIVGKQHIYSAPGGYFYIVNKK